MCIYLIWFTCTVHVNGDFQQCLLCVHINSSSATGMNSFGLIQILSYQHRQDNVREEKRAGTQCHTRRPLWIDPALSSTVPSCRVLSGCPQTQPEHSHSPAPPAHTLPEQWQEQKPKRINFNQSTASAQKQTSTSLLQCNVKGVQQLKAERTWCMHSQGCSVQRLCSHRDFQAALEEWPALQTEHIELHSHLHYSAQLPASNLHHETLCYLRPANCTLTESKTSAK